MTTTTETIKLTPREAEIAALCAQAMNVNEIAMALRMAPNTVKVHKANIYRKLGISNVVELVNYLYAQKAASK